MNEQANLFDLAKAEELKREGIEAASMSEQEKLDLLRSWAVKYASSAGEVTADDVRRYAISIGITLKQHAWGALFRSGGFYRVGWRKSRYVSNHARYFSVWKRV